MLFSGISYSQSYQVNVSGFAGSAGYFGRSYTISGAFGTRSGSSSNFNGVPSVPTSFSIEFYNSFSFDVCTRFGTVTSSSICGGNGSWTSTTGSCGGGGNSAGINLVASPELSIFADSPAGTYCSNQSITFRSTSGFGSYTWYYQIESSGWVPFATNSNTTFTFGIQDIFGSSFASYYNKKLFFGYGIAGCGITPYSTNDYTFYPPQVAATFAASPPNCLNGNDGSISVSTYSRSPIAGEIFSFEIHTSPDINPASLVNSNTLAAGNYFGVARSNLGCGTLSFPPVTVPSGPRTPISASSMITSPVTCNGASDGQITVNASGGVVPYQYSLNGGAFQSTNTFNVGTGTYDITTKDNCPAPNANTITNNGISVGQPSAVSISSAVPSFCNNGSNGQITVSASGGTGTLTYSKDGSNFQTGNVFTGLASTSFTVTAKDANGCTTTTNVSVPTPVSAGSVSVTHPTCTGNSLGSLSISGVSGGTPGYSWQIYNLSNVAVSASTAVANSISVSAGTYYAKVTDANGCSVNTSSFVVNAPISASYTSVPASCATVSDGSLTINGVTGGNGSYTYSINNGAFGASTTFPSLSTGASYILNVKDGNGCEFTINNAAVALLPSITGTISQTSFINCFGQSTASISVTPSGGTAPYTYTWSNGVTSQNNPNITAGSYNVIITDSKTCTGTTSISITQPTALTVTPSAINISCKGGNNGSIDLVVNGGTGVKTFLWSNGATSQNISGLAPGSYSVTVTDANGCINNTTSVTIIEPTTNVSVSLQSKTNVTCFGSSNGSILVTASGGTGTITYSKDGTNFQASASFTGLALGNYTITAKDANNCTQITSAINITQPSAALAISGIVKNNPLCNGNANGSLVVTVTGGTAPYQYSIDGTNFLSASTINGLVAGNYLVTIKDANNCTIVSASQSLVNPTALSATVTGSPQSCSAIVDGRLTVSASGGTGALQYSIDGTSFQVSSVFNGLLASNYTVTIKDANNCSITRLATVTTVTAITGTISQTAFINCFGQSTAALNLSVSGGTSPFTFLWSSGAITQNISSLPAGSYSVTITDAKGCTSSASFSVTQPIALSATTATSNYNGFGVTCNGAATGFINLTVSGGTSPYTYAWSNGATIKDISSLTAGSYSVTVTDSKGCSTIASSNLTTPTTVAVALASKANVTCSSGSDGSVALNASGGAGIYNYSKDGIVWQASNTFTSLPQGSYTFLAKDQNNCSSPTPLAVTITQPAAIVITFSGFQNANCGAADGAVQAIASGGTGALTYQWKDQANNVVGNASTLSNVVSGSYTVTVTDQSSCSKTSATSVGSNGGAVFTVESIVSTSCFNSPDGKAQVNISSGVGPFTITWSSGETGTSAIQLPGGSNSVTIKDASNCSVSSTFTIPSPAAISLSAITKTSPDCVGGTSGSIQVTAVGGNGGYSYQWNGTNGTNILSGIASGTYSLQIKDAQNCLFTQSIVLDDPPTINIAVVNQVSPSCSSATDGSIQVLASGGSGGFSYSWNTGATSASITGLVAGTYIVTAKDSKNCTQPKSISLVAASPLSVSIVSSSMVSCFGGVNGSVTLSASGGTGTYEYSVNGGSTWQTPTAFANLTAGLLDIRARDTNGCTGNNSFSITQPTALTSSIGSVTNTTCAQANGSATILGSGGTGPYTYQWFNSANQLAASTNTLLNASAGNYQVTTTDVNACTIVKVVTIAPSTNVSFSISNVLATKCSTSSDGSAQVSNVAGKAPYTFLWSSGETTATAMQLTAGTNTVKVADADGCSLQQTFSVTSPSAISLISETVFSPLCAGGNGSIQVTVAGGSSPYTYQWNGQSGTGFNQNIKAGNYQLIVTDANGCTFNKTFTVTDPAPYTIDLGPDKKICTGGVLAVTSPVDASSYLWTSTNGFNNTGKQVILTQPGSYKLRVTNTVGCIAEDTFVLTTSSDLLKADFLMAPVAHVGDTVMAIDISWPLPDRIGWTFPQEATILVQSQDYASMIFKSEGKFPVKLTANLAECQSEYSASIEIIKRGETAGGGSGSDLIKSLTAFPNPTSENRINLKIELSEVAPVRVRLVSLEGNTIVTDFNADAKDLHEFEIRLDGVTKGVYFLLVDVRDQKRVVRIVVI